MVFTQIKIARITSAELSSKLNEAMNMIATVLMCFTSSNNIQRLMSFKFVPQSITDDQGIEVTAGIGKEYIPASEVEVGCFLTVG